MTIRTVQIYRTVRDHRVETFFCRQYGAIPVPDKPAGTAYPLILRMFSGKLSDPSGTRLLRSFLSKIITDIFTEIYRTGKNMRMTVNKRRHDHLLPVIIQRKLRIFVSILPWKNLPDLCPLHMDGTGFRPMPGSPEHRLASYQIPFFFHHNQPPFTLPLHRSQTG